MLVVVVREGQPGFICDGCQGWVPVNDAALAEALVEMNQAFSDEIAGQALSVVCETCWLTARARNPELDARYRPTSI